jgi:hypothetical protein
MQSPRISNVSWGRLEVEGHGSFKDAKLFPGGAREWDWSETGTSHRPGIQPADIEELLDRGATVLVLGTGMYGRLLVSFETTRLVEARGVTCHQLRTERAAELYNQLLETDDSVAGLFHTTC